ncbi:MAG: hypothetical protein HQK99_17475 [Nitrospirae bacterium]|nr:hypothetical protein [Nitrospirota bacterium]
MEDSDKDINTDRLIVLLGEIKQEISRSPIDPVRLGELLYVLDLEIQRLPIDSGRSRELLLEVYHAALNVLIDMYNSALKVLTDWSFENTNKNREEYLHCLQTCIEEDRFQLSKLVSDFDLGNPPLNRAAGLVPPKLGAPAHPTSWPHWLQHELKKKCPKLSRLDSIAKNGGRYLIAPTVLEGFYDIGTMGYCAIDCLPDGTLSGEPCDNKSCRLFPYIDGLMIE